MRVAVLTVLGVTALVVAAVAVAGHGGMGGAPLSATLTGAAERPGPGDPDGSGTFVATANPGQGELCYELTVADIDGTIVGAHVHRAPVTAAGPIVIPLATPTDGSSSGCVEADRALLKAIIKNPEAYYVNVHSLPGFGPGAVRGQLSGPGS